MTELVITSNRDDRNRRSNLIKEPHTGARATPMVPSFEDIASEQCTVSLQNLSFSIRLRIAR